MPRIARKDMEGKHYHIMVQGIDKEYIFADDNCKGFYIACLQKNKEKYPVKIIGFCVMGNHAHILLTVENSAELAGYMKRVNADYARYFNRTRKRAGYVFRDRYRSEIVRSEKQLMYCLAYIHNNPIKAGIADKAIDYIYSSYTNYILGSGLVDFDEAARYFDISLKNIKAIMKGRSVDSFMEHDDREYENSFEVLNELAYNYNIKSKVLDDDLLKKIAIEIHSRCGTSYRELASMLGVNREKLRKLVSGPSP